MSINKNMRKSLILTLGLVVGGLYTSTHNIYAAEKEVVRTEILNVRKGPSIEEAKIQSLEEGSIVEIIERNAEWNKIKISEEEGWIHSKYTSNEKGTVTTNKLNVRKGPSTEEEKVDFLNKGTDIEILEAEDNWYKVKSEDKKTGWVSQEYILTETQAKELEKEALAANEAREKESKEVTSQSNNTVESNKVENNDLNNNAQNNNIESNNTEEDKTTSSNNNSGRSMTVNASAYSGHTITATGTTPKWGTIAVDPTVIPYGTRVYIPMFDMVFVAEDCGGAIKGNKIDIFMNSESETRSFGRRNIEIQVLG
ncbi:MAG: SH3 domain-containing protein [Romboutsia sp.]|uniref:SH3 domain-containing protein n=1 Tax=Romboutsia sp. TaxID=1965302 RepID=UPI003F3B358C